MQTFLPYPDLRASCVVLDDRRLGKQRVETLQILRALTWETYAWRNHPAVRMWRGFVPGLVRYGRENCREWMRRGYADSVADQLLAWTDGVEPDDPALPPWFGWEPLHRSHRRALLRKEPEWYAERFAADVAYDPDPDAGYLWPPDVFPTWPVRPDGPVELDRALRLLGMEQARPGQAEAAAAVAAGRDVLAVFRPGSGGSTAGLLAGLAAKGRTLWIHPPYLPRAGAVPAVVGPPPREVAGGAATELTARAPGPADLYAMRAEAEPPDFVFLPADAAHADAAAAGTDADAVGPGRRQIPDVRSDHRGEPFGLIVVDRADRLDAEQARAVAARRRSLGNPPMLVLIGRGDATQRAEVGAAFALHDPVHVGGGWNPGSELALRAVASARARADLVAALVDEHRPAVVVCPSREAADRRATRLRAAGLAAQVWAPPPMRPTRAAAALAAFRARRLAALVVAADALPPRGRGRIPLLVSENPLSLEAWRAEIEAVGADRSVLVLDPDADPALRALPDRDGLRTALLDHFGEPGAVSPRDDL